jgi:hypothetical protein
LCLGPLEPNWYEEDEGPESWLEEGQEVKGLSLGYGTSDDVVSTHNKRFLREYIYMPEAAIEQRSRK